MGIGRQATGIVAGLVVLMFGLSGCVSIIEDYRLRGRSVADGVDQTASVDALAPRFPIIRFELGEMRPSSEAEKELRDAARSISELDPQQYVVLVEGHSDSTGPVDLNRDLSEQRARNVADILLDEGVDPALIEIHGFGPNLPVASNALDDGSDHPAGRRFNRRVEIMVAPRSAAGLRETLAAATH